MNTNEDSLTGIDFSGIDPENIKIKGSEPEVEAVKEEIPEAEEGKEENKQPEAKSETEEPKEVVDAEKEETPLEETQKSQEEPETDPDPEPEPVDYSELAEDIGLPIESDEDIVNLLKEYKELKEKDPLEDLPKEIRGALDIVNSGGDLTQYFRLLGTDFDKMSDKEVLYQKFLQDNPRLSENEKFAKKQFEREYTAKYTLKEPSFEDEEEKQEWLNQNAEEAEYLKELAQETAKGAREDLNKYKQDHLSPKVDKDTGITDEERDQMVQEYQSLATKELSDFNGINLNLGKTSEGKDVSFTLGVNKETEQQVKEWALEPMKMMEYIGIDLEKGVDVAKLIPSITLLAHMKAGTLGEMIKDYSLDSFNRETLQAEKDNPAKVAEAAQSTKDDRSPLERAIDAGRASGKLP